MSVPDPQHLDHLTIEQLQDAIAAAFVYERELHRRIYRTMRFRLACQAKCDHMLDLGHALSGGGDG